MSELENAKELVEREVIATQTRNTIVINDGTNRASIPGFPYAFEAKGDKVLVSVDIYKTGYECTECKGTGRIKSSCLCDFGGIARPGFKYHNPESPTQEMTLCPQCGGDYLSKRIDIECPKCKGKPHLLHIPDTAKSLPTTGVIVSLGNNVTPELGLKIQDRVLFGAYTGVMIPTKAPGVVFKVLRDIEILCVIYGGEDMAAFDFVTIDKELS